MQTTAMKVVRSFYTYKNRFLLKPNPISLSRHFHLTTSPFLSKESGLAVHSSANDPIPIDSTKKAPLVWSVFDPISDGTVAQSGASRSAGNGESELRLSSFDEEVDGLAGENLIKREKSQMGLPSNRNEIEDLKKEKRYVGVKKGSSVNGAVGSGDRAVHRTKGKSKTSWVCEICGFTSGQWWGSCRSCNEVGTMKQFFEAKIGSGNKVSGIEASENAVRSWMPQKPGELRPLRLTDVNRGMNMLNWRIPLSGLFGSEVERVLGGGLVPGSLVLVGGDPGVGKSTLLLQIAAIIADSEDLGGSAPVVYVSGEESVEQIGNRADRMEIGTEELYLYSSTDIEDILGKIQHLSPRALIIDSIQTVYLKGVAGSAGGLSQVKECTSALLRFAKTTNIPILLIGHVNKSGDIAGPRVLEHIVDVVLYMEGEKYSSHRLLRPVKNRFGSTDELGVFEMSQLGLAVVSNPSEIFLTEQHSDSDFLAGLAVAVIMDGSRSFLIEIQALCVSGSSVSRHINGIQSSRADMIISVLIKQAGLMLQENAIFLNVVSGVILTETAGDVAIAAAICSSFLEFPIPNNIAFIGEIGLGGELRAVSTFFHCNNQEARQNQLWFFIFILCRL
ncbi:DNA repair protein RadA-like [Populus alba x Populus x berolinensis]|nr:DNA repair protein RadA-like [Populus alba x Populus x berolinensis]